MSVEDLRYFPTASNVSIFLNSLHVDLAYRVDWKEASDKIPIYGYNDTHYSRVVQSKSIIQGFVIVDFIYPGYLSAALQYPMYKNKEVSNQKLYNKLDRVEITPYSTRALENLLKTELPANSSLEDRKARAEYIASLVQNPSGRSQAKEALKGVTTVPVSTAARLYEKLVDTSLLLKNQPKEGSVLDIYYGDPSVNSWFSRFENVYFTDVSQQISQAGAEGSSEPLYEIYQFIASNKKTVIKR